MKIKIMISTLSILLLFFSNIIIILPAESSVLETTGDTICAAHYGPVTDFYVLTTQEYREAQSFIVTNKVTKLTSLSIRIYRNQEATNGDLIIHVSKGLEIMGPFPSGYLKAQWIIPVETLGLDNENVLNLDFPSSSNGYISPFVEPGEKLYIHFFLTEEISNAGEIYIGRTLSPLDIYKSGSEWHIGPDTNYQWVENYNTKDMNYVDNFFIVYGNFDQEYDPAITYRAVIYGIGEYSVPSINKVPYCANNARLIKTALDKGSINWDMRLRIDSQATRQNLIEDLKWLGNTADRNDVSLFYISSHGQSIKIFDDYFVESTVLYDGYFYDLEYALNFSRIDGNTVAIFDSCYSGGLVEEIWLLAEQNTENHFELIGACQKASPEQTISEYFLPEDFHYLPFSQGFISGLLGSKRTSEGIVYAEDCYDYGKSYVNSYKSAFANIWNEDESVQEPVRYDNKPNEKIVLNKGITNKGPAKPTNLNGPTTDLKFDEEYEYSCEVGDPDDKPIDVFFYWGDITYDTFADESSEIHTINARHIWRDTKLYEEPVKVWVVTIDDDGAISWADPLGVDDNKALANHQNLKQLFTNFFGRLVDKLSRIINLLQLKN